VTFARRRDDVFITGEQLVHGVDRGGRERSTRDRIDRQRTKQIGLLRQKPAEQPCRRQAPFR